MPGVTISYGVKVGLNRLLKDARLMTVLFFYAFFLSGLSYLPEDWSRRWSAGEKESKSMARAKKDFRALTVSEATNYGRKTAPMLRIQGLWLQELGFNIGDPVLVKCEDGKLIITQDPERVALNRELEEETKKLQAMFMVEKKKLEAKYVAERKERYRA
jgi:hypothetical protein